MELRGDFTSYSEILDLLQIVSIGKKTGEVLLNRDGESITIQLKEGRVVNFKTNVPFLNKLKERVKNGEVSLSEALKFILHYVAMWEKGRFSFLEKEIKDKPLDSVDTVTVMMDFTKEQDELTEELKELYKRNPFFSLSDSISEPVTLDREDWKLISLLSKGENLIKSIFTGANSFKTGLEKIKDLTEKGLLKEVKPAEIEEEKAPVTEKTKMAFVNPDLLEKVREVLVEAMGPMGEFLIEETFEDMEISNLPVNMIDTFVENLVEKIPDSCLIEGESCKDRLKEQIALILKGGANES